MPTNIPAEPSPDVGPDNGWITCPACGEEENIFETRPGTIECGECETVWNE